MISLEKAQEILLKKARLMKIEEINIFEGINRVLAEEIISPIDSPPFDKSPLDGYALSSSDLRGVSKENPKEFHIIDKVFAGEISQKVLDKDTAIRIMTGAKIPQGADCIVKQEFTEKISDNRVKIFVSHEKNENIIFKGEDFNKGTKVIEKNILLDAAKLTAIASLGINKIKVYKKPIVGIITTGDELQDPGQDLKEGKIFNSNKTFLYMRLKELGAEPRVYEVVGDTKEEIIQVVHEAEKETNIIISTGGVSVGEKDLVKEAVKDAGYDILFWKVDMKPGSPMFAAYKEHSLYIGLTGTPVAAATTFELTARRVIGVILNSKEIDIKRVKGVLQEDFKKQSNKRRFLRVKIELGLGNKVYINNIYQSPGQINTMINSNGLLEVKPNETLEVGNIVEVII